MIYLYRTFIILGLFFISCSSDSGTGSDKDKTNPVNDILVDSLATTETVALYKNLEAIDDSGVLFGHQDDLAYGVGWMAETGRSDVKEVCGDYPAVYGWDLGDIQNEYNLDGVNFDIMRLWIKEVYNRGGINTISMHLDNPVTGGDAWDNTKAVDQILPGKVFHSSYMQTLELITDFLASLKTNDDVLIPIIFRPYHEHNHSWPWWGSSSCSVAEYNALWKMTVEYLRDTRGLHNLIYAISPQDITSAEQYLERYPGDDYVDVLGTDNYLLYNTSGISRLATSLDIIGQLAASKNKICALTEVGYENIPIANWWTQYLLKAITTSSYSKKAMWALVWRNASASHHFAPYPGDTSANDFIGFYNSSFTYFESDLPDLYHE